MSKTCTILAHVRNSNGEIVESNLFKDLLHYTSNNRELAKQYYKVGTAEEFLSKVRDREDFETDENGEITFKSLNSIAKIDLERDKLIETLNKDIHSGNYNYTDAIKKIQYFNEHNIFADTTMATIVPSGKNSYFVSVIPISKSTIDNKGRRKEEGINSNERQNLFNVVRNKEIESKIISLLKQHQVSVKFLEGEKEGARYSTENIRNAENGLYGLIEVIEKGNVTDTLAEEAGHFAIGALGEYPLVRRLEALLSNENTQRKALGAEEYDKDLLGDNPAREVAGKLVGKALQRKLDNTSNFKILANRIANLAKRVFYNFTGNEMRWASAKAEQIANKIAYQFAEGSENFSIQNAINIKETMHNASLSINVRTYRDIMNEFGKMCKQLDAIANDSLSGQIQASFGMSAISGSDDMGKTALQYANEQVDAVADSLALDGIVQALVQVNDYLGPDAQIDRLMKSVDLSNPAEFYSNMARNGKSLRQARVFLRSAEVILNQASIALDPNHLGGSLKISNGSSLNDVRYQDENGTWHSINLQGCITSAKAIVAMKKSVLTNLESSYFARFCEDIYGKKYISMTTGKLWKNIWNGEKSDEESIVSIADMISGEGIEDIDIFHRYLGSMSNNPDVIGQIVDKIVKVANKTADDITIRYQERLAILKDRADKLGINMEDLMERDDRGFPTGNIITPPASPTEHGNLEEDFICQAYMEDLNTDNLNDVYAVNHGKWENARDEFKKNAWENFKRQNPDWQSMSGLARGLKWDEFFRPLMKDWNVANSIKVTVKDDKGNVKYIKWVPNAIYKSNDWSILESKYNIRNYGNSNDSLRRWMHDYMEIKQELDSLLPEGAAISYRLPQFRATFMNTVRNRATLMHGPFKKTRSWLKTFGRRGILESFGMESDETDYGDMTTMNHPDDALLGTKLDYEEERAARLPIFGVNKLQNMNDLSGNLMYSTLAYASMATSYNTLSNVVHSLEVGRDVLYNRKFTGSKQGSDGIMIGNRTTGNYENYSNGTKNRAYCRYLKFLNSQVYGIHAPYYGFTFKNGKRFLLNKWLNNLSSLGGSLFLKGNVPGGAVNTITGFNNIFKEAVSSEYFSIKDWAWGHKYYFSNFVQMWAPGVKGFGGDLGSLRKDNRLDLFLTQMNAHSNNREKFRNWHTSRSRLNNFYRMVGYLPYSSGDHYMQAMSYLSVAHGTKLYNTNGTMESNLWDAWERKRNFDDKQEFSYGYTIEFNKLCPLDASELTSDNIDKQGVYLKGISRGNSHFLTWLYSQDSQFKDIGYRSQHIDEYDKYREAYHNMSDKALMDFQSNRYSILKSILGKVENYVSSASPLAAVPTFTSEELQYLSLNDLGTGNYQDILQKVRNDIYNMIWTKSDESAYMDKCREINNRLHGIYNQQDKTAWHNSLYTNAFLAMKGWALGYLEYMFSPEHYSIALGKNVEGFVNTALKVPFSVIAGRIRHDKGSMGLLDMFITMTVPWTKRSKRAMLEAGFSENQNFNARRMAISMAIIVLLTSLFAIAAPPDEDEEDDELNPMEGLVYYLTYRALLEQMAFLYPGEAYIQSGSLMDFVPVGIAAIMDLFNLGYEGIGAMVSDEDNSNFFYQSDDTKDRYEEGDSKFGQHLMRLVPYWKSWWALNHPYEAKDNYEFGRKLRSR